MSTDEMIDLIHDLWQMTHSLPNRYDSLVTLVLICAGREPECLTGANFQANSSDAVRRDGRT
jgi:hypothetical protein